MIHHFFLPDVLLILIIIQCYNNKWESKAKLVEMLINTQTYIDSSLPQLTNINLHIYVKRYLYLSCVQQFEGSQVNKKVKATTTQHHYKMFWLEPGVRTTSSRLYWSGPEGNKWCCSSLSFQAALFPQILSGSMMSHKLKNGNSQLAHWNHFLFVFQKCFCLWRTFWWYLET